MIHARNSLKVIPTKIGFKKNVVLLKMSYFDSTLKHVLSKRSVWTEYHHLFVGSTNCEEQGLIMDFGK